MLSRPLKAPSSPGVYIFKRRGLPIYIGKAGNLKNRLTSYWKIKSSEKVKSLIQEATRLDLLKTESEIEALIKESELIKKFQPKYNVLLRDDKNYFYVEITREKFPRISITHPPQKPRIKKQELRSKNLKFLNSRFYLLDSSYVGPFTSGSALKTTLKLLRKIFPYCTCRAPHRHPCLNSQIEKCLGFCCAQKEKANSIADIKKYAENIKNIKHILSGKKTKIARQIKKEMMDLSKKEKFEEAAIKRNLLNSLENIFKHSGVVNEPVRLHSRWGRTERELQSILGTTGSISRIEGYDISNISGQDATGSMVVFTSGLPDKKEYRHFRIKKIKQISDVDMLKEVLKRRFRHDEWPSPDLILIDGGITQLNAALSIIEYNKKLSNTIVLSLAKKEEEIYNIKGDKECLRLNTLPASINNLFRYIRDESHRFARRYHHRLRSNFFR